MSVLIVGAHGSMGRRYQAILKHLGKSFLCAEVKDTKPRMIEMASRCEGVIIATPTGTHVELIRLFLPFVKNILCEKPITKSVAEMKELVSEITQAKARFSMMLQYGELTRNSSVSGITYYDYFNHGQDGLVWDCFQPIALAEGEVMLAEESPIWKCRINGLQLDLSQMDWAYVNFVRNWYRENSPPLALLVEAHEKVAAQEKKALNGPNN